MTTIKTTLARRSLRAIAAGTIFSLAAIVTAVAAEQPAAAEKPATAAEKPAAAPASEPAAPHAEHFQIPRQEWTVGGLFGYFDEQQLRRGYKIYKNVCANCHNMRFLAYRNLGEPGGPNFSKEEVAALAAEIQVQDGYNDQGEPVMRPGKPSDYFQWHFKNEKEAGAAFNGAAPPDLSVMAKARTVERDIAWYTFPFLMLKDLFTQYQEQGPDYLYALLTGYVDPPAGFKLNAGSNYNRAFPGHQIAMPQPLTDGAVDYEDGTPNTLDQESKDVVAFLAWAAEPHLVERKKLGILVLAYLAALAGLLFVAKKTLWRNVEH
jgi:ubiquinol-cytochrome c reductase cytochrome b/c1 subunit